MIAALAAPELLAEIGGAAEVVEAIGGVTITVPLKSSAIASASYTLPSGPMTVTMTDGTAIEYPDTPSSTFLGLVNSASPGSFYNAFIRGRPS